MDSISSRVTSTELHGGHREGQLRLWPGLLGLRRRVGQLRVYPDLLGLRKMGLLSFYSNLLGLGRVGPRILVIC